jgi:hypothetical protein
MAGAVTLAVEWTSLTVASAFVLGAVAATIAVLRLLRILEHRDRPDR